MSRTTLEPRRALPATPRPQPRPSALPWLAWFLTVAVVALSTTNAILLAVLVLAAALAAVRSGPGRRPVFTAASGLALGATTVWTVWSLLIHRDGLGGTVLWVLPAWIQPSGGSFGGAVTLAQLHLGLVHALQATVILLSLGLLGQQVAAPRWLLLADTVLGRAAGLVAPLACSGDAYLHLRQESLRARAAGFRPSGGAGIWAAVPHRAQSTAEVWVAGQQRPRGALHGVLGFVIEVALLLCWSVAILPGRSFAASLSTIEVTALWLAAMILTGIVMHPRDWACLRPTVADLPAILGTAALLAAWVAAPATGETDLLATAITAMPSPPVVSVAAALVMPLGVVIGGSRS